MLINNHAKPDEDYVFASVISEEDLRIVADEAVSCLSFSRWNKRRNLMNNCTKCTVTFEKAGWKQSKAKIEDPEIRRFHGR